MPLFNTTMDQIANDLVNSAMKVFLYTGVPHQSTAATNKVRLAVAHT